MGDIGLVECGFVLVECDICLVDIDIKPVDGDFGPVDTNIGKVDGENFTVETVMKQTSPSETDRNKVTSRLCEIEVD